MPFSLPRSAINLPTALAASILAPVLALSRMVFSSDEAAASVTAFSSSMSWAWMCLDERNTDSRVRPLVPAASFTLRRTAFVRRSVRSLNLDMAFGPLLLLAFLAEDVFASVFHAFALVGLGRAVAADFSGDLADFLFVDPGDRDLGRFRRHNRDAFRNLEVDVVGKTELQVQALALHRRAIADAVDLQLLLEALGHPIDQVGDQSARSTPQRARTLALAARFDFERAFVHGDDDVVMQD